MAGSQPFVAVAEKLCREWEGKKTKEKSEKRLQPFVK